MREQETDLFLNQSGGKFGQFDEEAGEGFRAFGIDRLLESLVSNLPAS
jgi:hypothetical protein